MCNQRTIERIELSICETNKDLLYACVGLAPSCVVCRSVGHRSQLATRKNASTYTSDKGAALSPPRPLGHAISPAIELVLHSVTTARSQARRSSRARCASCRGEGRAGASSSIPPSGRQGGLSGGLFDCYRKLSQMIAHLSRVIAAR